MFSRKNTKEARLAERNATIRFYQEKYNASVGSYGHFTWVVWGNEDRDTCTLKAWKGTAANYYHNLYWTKATERGMERMFAKIQEMKESSDMQKQYEEEKKEKRKSGHDLEVGDLLYTSWGYGQTNVSFFQVTKKVSKCFVEIRQVASETVKDSQGMDCDRRMPIKDEFIGEPMRKMAKRSYVLNAEYGYNASKYTSGGKGVYCSWYH